MDETMLEQADGPKGLQVMCQLMAEQVKGVKNKEQQKQRAAVDQSPGPPAPTLKAPNATSDIRHWRWEWGKERYVDEGEEFALTFGLSSLFLTIGISN